MELWVQEGQHPQLSIIHGEGIKVKTMIINIPLGT